MLVAWWYIVKNISRIAKIIQNIIRSYEIWRPIWVFEWLMKHGHSLLIHRTRLRDDIWYPHVSACWIKLFWCDVTPMITKKFWLTWTDMWNFTWWFAIMSQICWDFMKREYESIVLDLSKISRRLRKVSNNFYKSILWMPELNYGFSKIEHRNNSAKMENAKHGMIKIYLEKVTVQEWSIS